MRRRVEMFSMFHIIELRKSNGLLSILLHPPHPPLSPDCGGEDKGEGA